MKYFYLLFPIFLLSLITSCGDDDLSPIERLPDATTDGKNTFGCLVNENAWVADIEDNHVIFGDDVIDVKYDEENYLRIIAKRAVKNTDQKLSLHITSTPNDIATFKSPTRFTDFNSTCNDQLQIDTTKFHFVEITKLDTLEKIISGAFGLTIFLKNCDTLEITEGRFDTNYQLW